MHVSLVSIDGWWPAGLFVVVLMRYLLVLTAVALVTTITVMPWRVAIDVGGLSEFGPGLYLMTFCAVGLGAAAAALADLSGRLCGDSRARWIAAVLAVYCVVVVVVPSMVSAAAAHLAAFSTVTVLLLAAVRPPVRFGATGPWLAAPLGVLFTLAIAQAAAVLPEGFATVSAETVIFVWCVLATRLVTGGYVRGEPAMCGVGSGMLLVAATHLSSVIAGGEQRNIVIDVVRVLGMVVVLLGTLGLARRALHTVRSARGEAEDELRIAAVHMRRVSAQAAERDHELRNGLTGLSGVAEMLISGPAGPDCERLRSAVVRELSRLVAIVEHTTAAPPANGFDVGTVLTDATMLRGEIGAPITLECPTGLRACGTAAVLTQVITNVLSNCVRHAPGAAVTIRCRADDSMIVVLIADCGPGLTPGFEQDAVRRGVRGSSTGGAGLGLFISSALLAGQGGSLQLLPSEVDRRGCTVVIELRRADRPISPVALPDRTSTRRAAALQGLA